MPGTIADRADRDVTRRQAEIAVDPLDGAPDRGLVGQRFAHPHEHDVRHATFDRARPSRGAHHLFDDLAAAEVTGEPGLTGGAEPTPHRAPGLGAHADGRTVAVEHQHGLDPAPAVELPQELHRVAQSLADSVTAVSAAGRCPASSARRALRQVGPLVGLAEVLVQPVPHLIDAVAGLAVEEPAELVARHVVSRRCPCRRHRAATAWPQVPRRAGRTRRCGRGRRRGSAVQNASSVTSSPNARPSSSAVSMPARDSRSS